MNLSNVLFVGLDFSKTYLNSILALVHEPFKCAICDTRFGLKTSLNSQLCSWILPVKKSAQIIKFVERSLEEVHSNSF